MRCPLLCSKIFVLSVVTVISTVEDSSIAQRVHPIQITFGTGNDTEAAWSPDGKRIAFQSDRAGSSDIYILELESKRVVPLVKLAGQACFPAWSPDGRWIVYSYAQFTKTAFEGIENGYNIFIIPADGGEPRRLTEGRYRDYTPVFSRDGKFIYFSSTRNAKRNSVGIFSVPVGGGEPKPVIFNDATDVGFVQPDFSADGRFLVCGYVSGFRGNWTIRLVKTKSADTYPLTDVYSSFYAPRWSPQGLVIASTGYEVGDSGWNVWLIHADTGRKLKLTSGPGNSRSPTWSPDGKEVIYENNISGHYKLYRATVPNFKSTLRTDSMVEVNKGAVIRFSFQNESPSREIVPDLSGNGNDGKIHGTLSWKDGAISFGQNAYISVPNARMCNFDTGPFSVRASILLTSHTGKLRMICVGDYPGNRLGWQLFIGTDNHVHFNSRASNLNYRGAMSDATLPLNRVVDIVGVRLKSGVVQLFIDGALQQRIATGAFVAYARPNQVRIGSQYNGTAKFSGRLYEVTVYNRALTRFEVRSHSLAKFLSDQ